MRYDYMADNVDWWNSEEVADYATKASGCEVTSRAVNYWGQKGLIKSRRFGRFRYNRESVEKFVTETYCKVRFLETEEE